MQVQGPKARVARHAVQVCVHSEPEAQSRLTEDPESRGWAVRLPIYLHEEGSTPESF